MIGPTQDDMAQEVSLRAAAARPTLALRSSAVPDARHQHGELAVQIGDHTHGVLADCT